MVHRVLEQWNLNRWRGEPADVETLKPVFLRAWDDGQPPNLDWDGKEETLKSKSWAMLEAYLQQTPIPEAEKPEAVEVVVERDLDAHGLPPLRGVIDLVRSGGRIVDFKTTARTPNPTLAEHLNETQLGCYALLYREATGDRESSLEIYHLLKTKEPKLVVTALSPIDRIQTQRLIRLMESYVSGIQSRDFTSSPGMQCAWCDYLAECRSYNPNSN